MAYPETIQLALMRGVPVNTLTLAAATTSTSKAYAVPHNVEYINAIVAGTGTLSAGVVTLEEASAPDYAGTWSVIQTIAALSVTGGAQLAVHCNGLYRAIRGRVSTTITGGGTVDVTLEAGP